MDQTNALDVAFMQIGIARSRIAGQRWFDGPRHPFPCPRAPGCLACTEIDALTRAAQREPREFDVRTIDVTRIVETYSDMRELRIL